MLPYLPSEHCDIDFCCSLCERVNSGRVDGLKAAYEELIKCMGVNKHISLTSMSY